MGQIEIAFFNFDWICEVEIQIRSAAANMIKDWKRIYKIEIPQQQIKKYTNDMKYKYKYDQRLEKNLQNGNPPTTNTKKYI